MTIGSTGTQPTITEGNTFSGRYTKIGNVCTVQGYTSAKTITNVGTGYTKISGLPFTADHYYQPIFSHNNMFPNASSGYTESGTDYFLPMDEGSVLTISSYTTGVKYFMFTVTYRTNV